MAFFSYELQIICDCTYIKIFLRGSSFRRMPCRRPERRLKAVFEGTDAEVDIFDRFIAQQAYGSVIKKDAGASAVGQASHLAARRDRLSGDGQNRTVFDGIS